MKTSSHQLMIKALIGSVFAGTLIASVPAFAEPNNELREGPCNKILDACKSYAKTSKTKISLYRDCMQPLLNNEKVAEIKIDADTLKACQAKKAEIKQKK
jgi:hypothetical protein